MIRQIRLSPIMMPAVPRLVATEYPALLVCVGTNTGYHFSSMDSYVVVLVVTAKVDAKQSDCK